LSHGALRWPHYRPTFPAMPAAALATLPDGQATPKPTREPRISKRMRQALASLATKGMTQREAARQAGISEFHLSRELRKPQVQVFIARKARETIGAAPLRASARLVELIDANSEHVAAQVSERILTSEGILKSDQRAIAVNVDVKAGFILDLRDDPPSQTPQQRTIEAKPLIEQGERSLSGQPDDE
jgi:AraC-like DNA-binding protein